MNEMNDVRYVADGTVENRVHLVGVSWTHGPLGASYLE